jgi:hypothetical protein
MMVPSRFDFGLLVIIAIIQRFSEYLLLHRISGSPPGFPFNGIFRTLNRYDSSIRKNGKAVSVSANRSASPAPKAGQKHIMAAAGVCGFFVSMPEGLAPSRR